MILEGAGNLDGLEYAVRCRFERAVAIADAAGVNIRVTSGWRGREEQQQLYDRWLACREPGGTKKTAASCRGVYPAYPPGESMHELGLAIDSFPVPTPKFNRAYNEGASAAYGFGGRSPTVPFSGFGESYASSYPLDAPVSEFTAQMWWKNILESQSLWVPSNELHHAEACEARELRTRGFI